MAASLIEQYLARAHTLLLAGATAAGSRVYRGRLDAFAADDLPALNLRRGLAPYQPSTQEHDQVDLEYTVECIAKGAAWETAADALHMQAHALLVADATLESLGRGLRLIEVDAEGESGEFSAGKLSARYGVHLFPNHTDPAIQA